MLPLMQTNAQLTAVFEGQDASIETSVLPAPIHSIESTMTSFGNASGVILSFFEQPAIFPQENDKVSWGNANATIHSTPQAPSFDLPVNFEELLAEKFKPILYLHQNEKYKPQEVQVVLDTADLYKDDVLVQSTPPALSSDLLASSTASDYKLDLDGDQFTETSPITNETYKNTAYAHITRDQGHVVLQYWFFYYFNDWQGAPGNLDFTHEGDWEFIQLIFPIDKTVQQIVGENIPPDQAVYSAHAGGYEQSWNAVGKDGNRPTVYVAKGSHANHLQKGFCDLDDQVGLGIDEAWKQSKLESIELVVILDEQIQNTFAWLLFGGKWGEHDFLNRQSPRGPTHQGQIERWFNPVAWTNTRTIEWDSFYGDRCDGDGDGIWNNADLDKETFSNNFEAPGPFDKETKGTITERGDREFKIKDAEVGGAYFEANPGNEIAIIKLDGFLCIPQSTITFKPSSERTFGIATCLSAEISIEEGSADFGASHNGIEVVATVNAGQTVHYDIVDNQLTIETSGEGEIQLTINGETTTVQAGQTSSVIEILIDIKPDSKKNRIDCKKPKQLIPVSILSTSTFDASTVDHTTVLFEGASEFHKDKKTGQPKRHGGGQDDEEEEDDENEKKKKKGLLFHFRLGDTNLTCESTEATLIGKTFSGDLFVGTDSIDMTNK